MVSKGVGELKVDELKRHLRALKAQGRKNAVQTGKKADLQVRLARIARDIGLDPEGTNWNAAISTRGGQSKDGVKTRAGAALQKVEKERNDARAERNVARSERDAALANLEKTRKNLVSKTEECEGIARNRNAWASKAQKKSSKKPVAFEVPAVHRAVPERIERRLAPKKHMFYDDPIVRARARHEMAKAQREWIMDDKRRRLEDAAAYREYVRAKKAAYEAPLPESSESLMLSSSVKSDKKETVRPDAKKVAPRRMEKLVLRAELREKAAKAARRDAAALASRRALENALQKARAAAGDLERVRLKRVAEKSASGAADRASKRLK